MPGDITRRFKEWPIWFDLTMNSKGKLTRLEEHDPREGGGIPADRGKTLEQTFIDHASDRIRWDDDRTRAEAIAFLAQMREDMNHDDS